MEQTNKKTWIFIVGAVVLIIAVALFFRSGKPASEEDRFAVLDIGDPFTHVEIPQDIDEATQDVLAFAVEETKKYTEEFGMDIWESWIAIGDMYSQLGMYEHAVAAYAHSLVITPNNILGHRNIAVVANRDLQDYPLASKHYRKALQNFSIDPTIYIDFGRMLRVKQQKYDEAEKLLREGLAASKGDADILIELIHVFEDSENEDGLKEVVEVLLSQYPDNEAYRQEWGSVIE
jgi:tetratricopeptide (TPR) repeat protein